MARLDTDLNSWTFTHLQSDEPGPPRDCDIYWSQTARRRQRIERVRHQYLHQTANTGAQKTRSTDGQLLPRRPARFPFGQRLNEALFYQQLATLTPALTSATGCSDGVLNAGRTHWCHWLAASPPLSPTHQAESARSLAPPGSKAPSAPGDLYGATESFFGSTHPRGLAARRRHCLPTTFTAVSRVSFSINYPISVFFQLADLVCLVGQLLPCQ